ncbi:MAG TPA: DUF4062 domain-containing protein [Pyrinomonadaceae bacterium]|nr:DUF4062 domain-containing protein [Pyrinomonadaceae bacterium]
MARFYVSSTYEDLKECRQSVCEALRRLHHEVVGMENYAAGTQAPLDKCLTDVTSCDVYVGIFAWRYGYVPTKKNPRKKSITELEYCKARDEGKELLIFLLHDAAPWPPTLIDKGGEGAKVEALRKGLKTDHLVKFFNNRQELEAEVNYAVAAIADKLGGKKEPPPEQQPPPTPVRPPFWKRHAKLLLAAAALVAVIVPTAAYLLKPIYLPPAYPKERIYDFPISYNLRENWDVPEAWRLDAGEGDERDGALLVKSTRMGMPKDLDGKVFYDFKAEFKVRFIEGSRVAWVLRAQPDGQSGYLFEIECRGGTQHIGGWVLENNQRGRALYHDKDVLNFSRCCDPKDALKVVVTATGYEFNYDFKFQTDEDSPHAYDEETNARPDDVKFEDGNSTFRRGSFGLSETDDVSVMKVEHLYLYPLKGR